MVQITAAASGGGGVISLKTDQDICRLAQTCEVIMEGACTGTPGGELVVTINGANRLVGYITEALTNSDGTCTISGIDKMKLALDNFLDEEVRVEDEGEQDAGWWINYWLEYAGIESGGAVETGRTVPGDLSWQYAFVSDIILECLGYAGGGYTVIIDQNGIAQIVEKTGGTGGHSFASGSNLLAFTRTQDDSWYRDRAVVFGTTSGAWVDGAWVSGEFTVVAEAGSGNRTVALSSSYIQNQAAAEDLANDILNFFNENLDIKRCLITGDESIWLGDGASVSDGWSGYGGEGIITSIETTIDDAGFRQLVSLDERCGFIWGWGRPYAQIMFGIPGTLTVGDDQPPWLFSNLSRGLTLRNTFAAVKSPSVGADIEYEIETSTNGVDWTSIHTGTISEGEYLSGEQAITGVVLEEDTLVRLNITRVGDEDTEGTNLTVSVGVKLR